MGSESASRPHAIARKFFSAEHETHDTMMRFACFAALVATGQSFQMAPSRPLLSSSATAARSVVKAAMPPFELTLATANLLAGLPGLGEGYGGKSAFSQTQSAEAGDFNIILVLTVIFPTLVTAYFFKDSINLFFNPPPEEIPAGWRKIPSQSRPGKFSYENIKTKERFDRLPNSAFK